MANEPSINRLNLNLDIPDPKLLENQIAELLRDGIVSGKLPLGGKLNEEELSSILKVSRTPIRQALHILELEGLIELIPRRGAFVCQMSQKDAEELYQILGMIEGFAVRQLIANKKMDLYSLEKIISRMAEHIKKVNLKDIIKANFDFHSTIVEMLGNRRLLTTYKTAQNATRLFQSMGLSSKKDWTMSLQDHRQILTAIRRGDAETASQLCLGHNMNRCSQTISRLFQNSTRIERID